MSFAEILNIDKHLLDEEWIKQPTLIQEYMEQLADLREEENRAKENIKIVKAELSKDIRTNSKKYTELKLTEGVISSLVDSNQNCKDAFNSWVESKHKVEVMESAVKALETKKYALENLVKLQLSGYYADPKISKDDFSNEERSKIYEVMQDKELNKADKPRTRRRSRQL